MSGALTPDELALAAAVDILTRIPTHRLKNARKGKADSARCGVPWSDLILLEDRLAEARPGWVERTREIMAEKS